jgi:superfamily II DNA or RNA helicase
LLAGVEWDPRCAAYRAPPWRQREIRGALENLEYQDRVSMPWALPSGKWSAIELRPYQQAALAAWRAAGERGMVALPTGSGKTRVAMTAIAESGAQALCIVPTRVLMHQWRDQLRAHYDGHVGCWGDGEQELAPITVMTSESAYRHMARIGHRYPLLIVDEVHHFGSGLRDEALEMSVAAKRLGLSATIPDQPESLRRLAELVGPVVFSMSVSELAGKYLADYDIVEIPVALEAREQEQYEREMQLFRRGRASLSLSRFTPWKHLVRLMQTTREGRIGMAAWHRARRVVSLARGKRRVLRELMSQERDRRVLVFTAENETAYAIARQELIMPITCDIKRRERDEVLARFRRGELRALVSARVLNEGVDVPDADVAIIMGGSHGEREHVQRVGRLLRPMPGKRAVVYEIVAAGTNETWQARRRRKGLGDRHVA